MGALFYMGFQVEGVGSRWLGAEGCGGSVFSGGADLRHGSATAHRPASLPGTSGSNLLSSNGSRRHTSRSSGFTLLELMIVVSLAALVVAIGLPVFVRAMKKEGLRRAVSDMVEGCSHARTQAILRGAPMELVISADEISVQPLRGRNPEGGDPYANSEVRAEPEEAASPRFSAQLAENVAIKLLYVNFQDLMKFPEARVRFFPNGTSDEFTVILAAADGEQKISLDVVTALADVEVIR